MRSFEDGAPAPPAYTRCARLLHWSTVVLFGVQIGVQIPVGLFMVRYGAATDFAAPSGIPYDGDKLLGLRIPLLAAARLAYRLAHGAPPSEPSLVAWQKTLSHVTHWAIYAMLFAVPLLRPFGLALAVLAAENGDRAERCFAYHRLAAYALIVLIGMHVGAALFHYAIRPDGGMRRMLAGARLPRAERRA